MDRITKGLEAFPSKDPFKPSDAHQAAQKFMDCAFLTWDGSQGRRMCPLAVFGSREPMATTRAFACVNPPRADSEQLTNADQVRGSIALVVRGGCSFAVKARKLQRAGAVAMIVANNTREQPFAAFSMEDDVDASSLDEPIEIPCMMMCLADVRDLFKQMPPSVTDGTITLEIVEPARLKPLMLECKEQRHVRRNGSTASSSEGGKNSSRWGSSFRRKTTSLVKFWDTPVASPKEGSKTDEAQATESIPVDPAKASELPPAIDAIAPASLPAPPPPVQAAPLFAFVQWATSASHYHVCFAPLSDFCRAGNNAIYEGPLTICDPLLADKDALRNSAELRDALALVKRGVCTFPAKLERIQRCGAMATIVGNDDIEDPDAAFMMSVDNLKADHLTIPSVMVSYNVLQQLLVLPAASRSLVRMLCLSGESAATMLARISGLSSTVASEISLLETPEPSSDKPALKLLHVACRNGDHGACQQILDEHWPHESDRRDAMMTSDNNRLTALHHSCVGGNEHVVDLVLRLGGSLTATDFALQTPLHLACLYHHAAIVKRLLQANGMVLQQQQQTDQSQPPATITTAANMGGSTPLHYAALSGSTECLELLLTVNARVMTDGRYCFDGVDIADRDGATPLHVACRSAHCDCAMYLIAANANVDVVDATGATPLQIACEMINDPEYAAVSLTVIEKLLATGASIREPRNAAPQEDGDAGIEQEGQQIVSRLYLDRIENKAVKRELEVTYLRREAQRSHANSQALERQHQTMNEQVSRLSEVLEAMQQREQTAKQRETELRKMCAAQNSQIEQLQMQMNTILHVLQSQAEPTTSAVGLSLGNATAFNVPTEMEDSQANEDRVLDAALARDLGKKCCRQRKYALAENYFKKSLGLHALPGVQRLLEQTQALHNEAKRRVHQQLEAKQQMQAKQQVIDHFRSSLARIRAPDHAIQSITLEIAKLDALEQDSTEFSMTRRWLEWLVALPWDDPQSGLQSNELHACKLGMFQQLEQLELQAREAQRHQAARVIQSAVREHFSVHLMTRSMAAVSVQAIARGFLTRRQFQRILGDQERAMATPQSDDNGLVCSGTLENPNTPAAEATATAALVQDVDFSVTIDPLALQRMGSTARDCRVVLGVHLQRRSSKRARANGGASCTESHVLQVLSITAASAPTGSSLGLWLKSPAASTTLYYVWSRWGTHEPGADVNGVLSGPYDQLFPAQQRYERVLRDHVRASFVVAAYAQVSSNGSSATAA